MIFSSVLCAMRFLRRDRFTARDLVFSPPPPDLCLISPPLISRSVFLFLALSFSPVALRNKGAGAIPDLRSEAQTSLLSCMVIVVLPGALLDGAFSCANIFKIGQLEKDNAALKAELSELKKSLDAQEIGRAHV